MTHPPLDRLGIEIGHHTDTDAETGMTVFIMRQGASIGVDIPGGNTGTLNIPAFVPGALCQEAHAVVITGGSTYGLASAFGVMRWLEEHGYGHGTRGAIVPGVTGAVIYDLATGQANVRPTLDDGYRAAAAASAAGVAVGQVGVGTGATTGKWYRGQPRRGGFATATVELPHGMLVSAFAVTNALGDIGADGRSNLPASGDDLRALSGTMNVTSLAGTDPGPAAPGGSREPATSLVVIATNVAMDNLALTRIARTGSQGLVRGMSPASLMSDGDTVFALSSHSGERLEVPDVDRATLVDVAGIGAAEAVRQAVLAAVAPQPQTA